MAGSDRGIIPCLIRFLRVNEGRAVAVFVRGAAMKKAACVDGKNAVKELAARLAWPGCRKCMEGSMRRCAGAKEPGSFFTETSVKKHMLSEGLDAKVFKTLGMGDAPFPRQPFQKIKIITERKDGHETKNA